MENNRQKEEGVEKNKELVVNGKKLPQLSFNGTGEYAKPKSNLNPTADLPNLLNVLPPQYSIGTYKRSQLHVAIAYRIQNLNKKNIVRQELIPMNNFT